MIQKYARNKRLYEYSKKHPHMTLRNIGIVFARVRNLGGIRVMQPLDPACVYRIIRREERKADVLEQSFGVVGIVQEKSNEL